MDSRRVKKAIRKHTAPSADSSQNSRRQPGDEQDRSAQLRREDGSEARDESEQG